MAAFQSPQEKLLFIGFYFKKFLIFMEINRIKPGTTRMYYHYTSQLHFFLFPLLDLSSNLVLGRERCLKTTIVSYLYCWFLVCIFSQWLVNSTVSFFHSAYCQLLSVLGTLHLAARGPSVHMLSNKDSLIHFPSLSPSFMQCYCDSPPWKQSILSALDLAENFHKN